MKHEILNLCPDANISVIYNGLNYQSFGEIPQNTIENIKVNLKVPGEFILSVGHFEERKNYENLLDAIEILKKNGLEVPLVIVGNDNGHRESIKKKIFQQDLGDLVQIHSNLKDLEVQALYRLCKLFIFPSIYEGFGIPILESMAAKTPIILSNLDVFKEITQNQGVYFDPDSPDDIAKTINSTLIDSSLLDNIVDYGNNRVKDFSFDSLALQLKNFYIVNK
jgi:glycosyltransferase involved in cell wall biosynthesis